MSQVKIRLSSILERSTYGTPLFDVTVEWEYTTVPSGTVRRFACVADRSEYTDLLLDVPATSPWFMAPRPGMDASSKEFYELLELSVNGEPQTIRRTARKNSQIYTAHLSPEARSGDPVRIRQVFRTVTPMWGHRLYFELPQPARNMALFFDYTNTSIAQIKVIDNVASARRPRVSQSPPSTPGREVSIDVDGWLMPKSGFAFTWTLEKELPRDEQRREAAQ